jgi:hypothetical protein
VYHKPDVNFKKIKCMPRLKITHCVIFLSVSIAALFFIVKCIFVHFTSMHTQIWMHAEFCSVVCYFDDNLFIRSYHVSLAWAAYKTSEHNLFPTQTKLNDYRLCQQQRTDI